MNYDDELQECTTPVWDDDEDLRMPTSKEQNEESMLDRIVDKIAGPVLVSIVIGAGMWMINIDRTTQALLYRQDAQTVKQDEIAKNIEKISGALPDISERLSFIEKTRFTQDQGNQIERKIQSLESDVEELKSRRK